jgi:uncharacterized protein
MPHVLFWYAVVSAFLVGVSKTGVPGVSILAIVLMTEAYPDHAADSTGAILPVLLAGDIFAVIWYRSHADWGQLLRLMPHVAIGMALGAWFLYYFREGDALRPVIGGLVLGMLAIEVCRRRFRWEHMPHRWWFVVSMGLLAGFTTQVANAAMPVMSIYLASQDFDKHRFIGTAAWFFLILNTIKVPISVAIGTLTPAMLPTAFMLMPLVILGAILGIFILKRIPERLFLFLALALAGVAAAKLLVT